MCFLQTFDLSWKAPGKQVIASVPPSVPNSLCPISTHALPGWMTGKQSPLVFIIRWGNINFPFWLERAQIIPACHIRVVSSHILSSTIYYNVCIWSTCLSLWSNCMHVHLSGSLKLQGDENTSVVQVRFHYDLNVLFSEGKLALITRSVFGDPPTKLWDHGHDMEVVSLADFDLWSLWQSSGMMTRSPGLILEDCRPNYFSSLSAGHAMSETLLTGDCHRWW